MIKYLKYLCVSYSFFLLALSVLKLLAFYVRISQRKKVNEDVYRYFGMRINNLGKIYFLLIGLFRNIGSERKDL